jgi:hypothetical protein
MEVQPDSAISGQERVLATPGLAADGQEAGHVDDKRLNGLMSSLGRRTTERDEAVAERDRLREQLAAMLAGEPAAEARGAAPEVAQLPESSDTDDGALEHASEAYAATELEALVEQMEIPIGSVIIKPDGSQILVTPLLAQTGGTIAPTSPRRPSPDQHQPGSVEALRKQFRDELPGAVADMRQRALLRGS